MRVRIGEGKAAEILRNLYCQIAQEDSAGWEFLAERIESLFEVQIEMSRYVPERGELTMGYRENGVRLNLFSSGRGL